MFVIIISVNGEGQAPITGQRTVLHAAHVLRDAWVEPVSFSSLEKKLTRGA